MLQVFSIAECWLGRFEKQRKRHTQSEIQGREKLLGWMQIYLFVQRVNQSRGRYPHFMHWVILLCVVPEMLC